MADVPIGSHVAEVASPIPVPSAPFQPKTLDEARALARERFKTKLQTGEKVGACDCHSEDEPLAAATTSVGTPAALVAGVRFRDSGRTYYFTAGDVAVTVGDWVVVETSRGREAGRVIIAPHQVRLNLLQGDLKPILRRLDDGDIRRMEALKRDAASAIKTFGAKARARHLPLKPITAEYSFDGSVLVLNFSLPERERPDLRELTRDLAGTFGCRVELRQVGARDEARLLGGLGRCGRTLCCSSWLPVYPEISMNLAKTQDLPLNPSKVSGVCGRLLCCLSYENEQYKQMKAVLPRLGQPIDTPAGPGMVVSLQVLKELVTVRLAADNSDVVFSSADLGLRGQDSVARGRPRVAVMAEPAPADEGVVALQPGTEPMTEDPPVSAAEPQPNAAGSSSPAPSPPLSPGAGGAMALYLVIHTPNETADETVNAPSRMLDLARASAEGASSRWIKTWSPDLHDDRIFSLWEAENAADITTAMTKYGFLDHMAAQPLRVQEWGPEDVLKAAEPG